MKYTQTIICTFFLLFTAITKAQTKTEFSSYEESIKFLEKSLVDIDIKINIKDSLFPDSLNINFKKSLFWTGRLGELVVLYPKETNKMLICDNNLRYFGDLITFPPIFEDIIDIPEFNYKKNNIELGVLLLKCEENSVKYFNISESGKNCETGEDQYAYYFYRKDINGQKEKIMDAFIYIHNVSIENLYGKQLTFETTCEFLNFVNNEIYKNKFDWHKKLKNATINDRFFLSIKDINLENIEVKVSWDNSKINSDYSTTSLDNFKSIRWEIKTESKKESNEILKKLGLSSTNKNCGGGMLNNSYEDSYLDYHYEMLFGDNLSGFYLNSFDGYGYHSTYQSQEFNSVSLNLYNPQVKKDKFYYIIEEKANKDFHLELRNVIARAESGELNLYIQDKSNYQVNNNYKEYSSNKNITTTTNNRVAINNSEDESPFYAAYIDISKLSTQSQKDEEFRKWKQYICYALGKEYEIVQEIYDNGETYNFRKTNGKGANIILKKVDNVNFFEIQIINY